MSCNSDNEVRRATLEIVQLSENTPMGNPGPDSWGGSSDGVEMVTFQCDEGEGFYGYLRGVTQGLYWEQDDQGPFDTRDEAEAELRSQYEHPDEY